MNLNIIFKSSLDTLAKIITVLSSLLFVVIIANIYEAGNYFSIGISMFIIFTYCLVFALRPIDYRINESNIIIHRLIKDVIIEKKHILDTEAINDEKLGFSFRAFSVGGLFGHFGKFYSSNLGFMTWYVTNRNKLILVKTIHNKLIVLSPDDVVGFINQFK